jgi:hypothetical protein
VYSNHVCVFLIFILPISLICLLFDFIIIMNIFANMTPIYTPNDIFWANLSFGLSLGLSVFGAGLAIAFAIWFGYADRLRDFLRESKKVKSMRK